MIARRIMVLGSIAVAVSIGAANMLLGGANARQTAPCITAPRPPPVDELRIALTATKIYTMELSALRGCPLQATLAKYNSSLGRYASDAQRLLLTLEYLRLAPACIETKQGHGESAVAATVEAVRVQAQQQLPFLIFNATLANTEFRQYWLNACAGAKPPAPPSPALTSLRALNNLVRRWLAGDYRADNLDFEIHLSEIARGAGATTTQRYHASLAVVRELEQHVRTALSPAYRAWRDDRDNYFTRLASATPLD